MRLTLRYVGIGLQPETLQRLGNLHAVLVMVMHAWLCMHARLPWPLPAQPRGEVKWAAPIVDCKGSKKEADLECASP